MTDKTLREAGQNLIDSMGLHQDLPPTLSSVDRLRTALADSADAPEGPYKVTDEMIRAALATELENGPLSQDIGFGMMRIILQNALNRLDAQQKET